MENTDERYQKKEHERRGFFEGHGMVLLGSVRINGYHANNKIGAMG